MQPSYSFAASLVAATVDLFMDYTDSNDFASVGRSTDLQNHCSPHFARKTIAARKAMTERYRSSDTPDTGSRTGAVRLVPFESTVVLDVLARNRGLRCPGRARAARIEHEGAGGRLRDVPPHIDRLTDVDGGTFDLIVSDQDGTYSQ